MPRKHHRIRSVKDAASNNNSNRSPYAVNAKAFNSQRSRKKRGRRGEEASQFPIWKIEGTNLQGRRRRFFFDLSDFLFFFFFFEISPGRITSVFSLRSEKKIPYRSREPHDQTLFSSQCGRCYNWRFQVCYAIAQKHVCARVEASNCIVDSR